MSVSIGLVGTSWWSDFMYVPAIKSHSGSILTATCGTDAERTTAFAARHGIAHAYTSVEAMLAAGGLDALIVATPDDTHKAITLAALQHGLHVLCEKPLALNAADAEDMLRAANAAERNHMVLFTWRWQPCFQYLKALLDEGFVGRPLRAQFSFASGGGYAQNYQWRLDGNRANGVLGDLGAHMIDLALWLVGDIAEISADAPALINRTGFDGKSSRPVNDTAHMTLKFADGAQGTIDVTTLQRLADTNIRIVASIDGEAGSIDVEYEPIGPNASARIRATRASDAGVTRLEIPSSYLAGSDPSNVGAIYSNRPVGARLFIDSILGGFKPEPGFEQALAVQRVIDAALMSHHERRWIAP
ncbi:MAG: Gfo/Idh/MocA family oxidoreductase [Devosia sp.]